MRRLYFAYGSNMAVRQMARRCPPARALGPARLDGWRFIINRRGTASIVPDASGAVHGVLWSCTADCIATLDHFEGVAKRRYRKLLVNVETGERDRQALVYAGLHSARGRAIRAYLNGTVLPAARQWDLPQDYLDELAALSGHTPLGPVRVKPRGRSWRP